MGERSDGQKIYEKYKFLLTEEKVSKFQDVVLNETGYLTMNFEDFVSSQPNITCKPNNIVPKLAEMIVNFGLVKKFDGSEDRDFDAKDFPFEAENTVVCFEYLNYLLLQFENIDTSSKRKFLVQVLLLCATHSSKYLWSCEKSVALSKDFLEKLLSSSNHKNLNALLCDDTFHPTIFKAVLKWMRPTLMKNTWMKNPSSCHVFYWFLSHVKHPYLVNYLPDIVPPAFMFSSYYAVPQHVLGIKCFDHILDNVPPSLIKADGTEDAIFDALKMYLYSKEISVIEVLYPCLLKLPMMNLQKVNQMPWLKFNVVLQQLLWNSDMELNAKLRYTFLNQVLLYIKTTPCFKHLKAALNILYRNLTAGSASEGECRIVSLQIMKELIKSCWPRMEHHCFNIILAILKVICDIEIPDYTIDDESSKDVLNLCEECLCLLKKCCPETFQNIVNEYCQEDDTVPGASLLKSILSGSD